MILTLTLSCLGGVDPDLETDEGDAEPAGGVHGLLPPRIHLRQEEYQNIHYCIHLLALDYTLLHSFTSPRIYIIAFIY